MGRPLWCFSLATDQSGVDQDGRVVSTVRTLTSLIRPVGSGLSLERRLLDGTGRVSCVFLLLFIIL